MAGCGKFLSSTRRAGGAVTAAGGGPPVSVGAVLGAGAGEVSGAGPGAVDVKGSRPGPPEAVVGELTTGAAGGATTTGGAWGFCLGALEQPPQNTARAVRLANQRWCLC